MHMIIATFAAAILLAEAPAPDAAVSSAAAPDAAQAPVVKPAAAKGPKVNRDGLICHNEAVVGTRIPKKICFTPAEAEDRAQQDQATLNRLQSQLPGPDHH
jgi:hypothetical protein